MIVVDTNVIASLFVGEPRERTVSERLAFADSEWTAPRLWRSELLATLRKYVRHRGLSTSGAAACFHEAESRVRTSPLDPEAEHVLALSAASDCSTYDCEFVALAIALGCKLATYDRKLRDAFPTVVSTPGAVAP